MTHHTEADRAMHECIGCGHLYGTPAPLSCDCCNNPGNEYRPWVARRAPAVPVPQSIEQMAVDRYKVVPSHSSMFYPCAVVAGDGQQQLYIGREVECKNIARKFTGAFLDGAFVALAAAPQPPEAAPVELPEPVYTMRVRGRMHDYTPTLSAFDLADGEHELYTEQQVRQLLSNHGIKVNK